MRLLLDENISWRLIKYLDPFFDEVVHVDQTSLSNSPTDKEIWEFARTHGYHIVTKDWDFDFLASIRQHPPKVVLLHNAQISVRELAERLLTKVELTHSFFDSEEYSLLEINL